MKINTENMGMQYSPKLKKAMAEIRQVLEKYDVGGMVVLHDAGGHTEFLGKLDPSFSVAWVEDGGVRIRARLNEDFGGDKEKWTKAVGDTVGMFSNFEDVGLMLLEQNHRILEMLEKHVEITPTGPPNFTTHETQNN